MSVKGLTVAAAAVTAIGATAAPALAFEAGDIVLRGRGIVVQPLENSDDLVAQLAGGGRANTGGEFDPSTAVMPEFDITYMITDNIGVELIAAATPHKVDIEGVTGVLPGDLDDAANLWLLPPTLSLQYHFDTGTDFKPYLGAGLNVTIPFGADAESNLERALGGATDVDLDVSVGYSLQAGIDYMVDDRWLVNLDFKYIDIDTEVTTFTPATGIRSNTDLSIDPIVIGFGVGYRF